MRKLATTTAPTLLSSRDLCHVEAVLSGLEFSESKPRAVVRTATFGAAVQEFPAKQWAAISPVVMGLAQHFYWLSTSAEGGGRESVHTGCSYRSKGVKSLI